jgi:hypothetical protein
MPPDTQHNKGWEYGKWQHTSTAWIADGRVTFRKDRIPIAPLTAPVLSRQTFKTTPEVSKTHIQHKMSGHSVFKPLNRNDAT